MKRTIRSGLVLAGALLIAASARADIISDTIGDIDPGIANGGGTLDIVSMEVTTSGSDLIFSLTLNGNVSTTDWGNFMIGIATGDSAGTTTGNGWVRPINLDAPSGGMNYWIGSWVNAGGGAQLWSYDNGTSSWTGPSDLSSGYSFSAGAQSTIDYTVSLSSLGVSAGDTIYFDAYSSGGGGSDSAVDALSNPNVSITSWGQTYTSSENPPGTGLSSYTIVPEPTTLGLLGLGVLAVRLGRKRKAT